MTMATITTQKIELGSALDTASFLIPCYGFSDPEIGAAYAEQQTALRVESSQPGDNTFAPLYRDGTYFMPRLNLLPVRPNMWQNSWLVSHLMSCNSHRPDAEPIWKVLRDKSVPMPVGARNIMLLVRGRRRFRLPYFDYTPGTSKLWHQLSTGERDCFAIWEKMSGLLFEGGMPGEANSTFIHAGRSGRGVLYAKTTTYDLDGHPNGFRTEVVCVQFSILEKDSTKDDLLKLQISARLSWGDGTVNYEDWDIGWRQLVTQAQANFEIYCVPTPINPPLNFC
jgi:hypothetical protein